MTSYDGLILDYDGVVVNVVDRDTRVQACCRLALREFREHGIVPNRESIAKLAHSVSTEEVQSLSTHLDTTPETLWRCRDDILFSVMTDAARRGEKKPYPDTAALFELDVPLGIASNNQRRVVEFIVEEYGIAERFGTIHAREPVLESLKLKKPSPTLLERAQADLGVSNPLFVGDKQKDVIAARRAGMDVAYIRREHNGDRPLEYEPTYEVTTLEEVAALFT